MECSLLNEILSFADCDYQVSEMVTTSGQRTVYKSGHRHQKSNTVYILKISSVYPTSVARIQRELTILNDIDSDYFPKSIHSRFISDETIQNFIDNPPEGIAPEQVGSIKKMRLRPFFVTVEEFINHLHWSECVEEFKCNEKMLVEFLKKLFFGLNILWEKKIVHRDLKPDNILINEQYNPVIIDLGIAQSLRQGTQILTLPSLHTPCTPQFASPEQLNNTKTEITYRSDQFSVGVLVFWILTGRYPFGEVAEIGLDSFLENVSKNKISKIEEYNPNVSAELLDFVYKLLNREPYQRFRNYSIIEQALQDMGNKL